MTFYVGFSRGFVRDVVHIGDRDVIHVHPSLIGRRDVPAIPDHRGGDSIYLWLCPSRAVFYVKKVTGHFFDVARFT